MLRVDKLLGKHYNIKKIMLGESNMSPAKILGYYLDQPGMVRNFSKVVPPILGVAAVGILANDVRKSPEKDRRKNFVRNGLTMFGAVGSSLLAPKITSKLFKTAPKLVNKKELDKFNTEIIEKYLSTNKTDSQTESILNKAKTKILGLGEVGILSKRLNSKNGKSLLNKLIPEPENITSKEIFSEIGRLSVFGFIPVAGGIAGGIAGDYFSGGDYKRGLPNKIKEGAYQYLANIFLCNVGAGAALGIMEKAGIKSKVVRAAGMTCGIILTGVIGGSAIANLIGKKVINKCFKNHNTSEDTRKPEPLDICLHSDDIATVAVMSGLKWIEPTLPALYSISGYRAGIGYRGKD